MLGWCCSTRHETGDNLVGAGRIPGRKAFQVQDLAEQSGLTKIFGSFQPVSEGMLDEEPFQVNAKSDLGVVGVKPLGWLEGTRDEGERAEEHSLLASGVSWNRIMRSLRPSEHWLVP